MENHTTTDRDARCAEFARWAQSEETRKAFQALDCQRIDREIQEQVQVFRKRMIINMEELRKPFTV